jgi:hypothetical protein
MLYRSITHRIIPTVLTLGAAPCIASAAAQRQSDFNGDGYADMAMPVSGEKIGQAKFAGAVNVIYGTAGGLDKAGNQFWHQDSNGLADSAEVNDYFADALAWGDFNNDGYSDLAVGAPGEDTKAGAVQVIYGSSAGLASANNQVWRQGANGLAGVPETYEYFGWALAVGDFNGDHYDDLAVSAPDQTVNGDAYAGAVHIILGSGSGLTGTGNQYWTQDSDGLDNAASEYGDGFGNTLAAGDFNGDGKDDLAIGVPFENFAVINCGAINILYGADGGLTAAGNQFMSQDSAGLAGAEQEDDYFGWSLAAGDFNGDGRDDLAVGSDGEKVGGLNDAGSVHVLYGSGNGIRGQGSQFWTQDAADILDQAEAGDRLGSGLAVGDFDNDGFADLVIGAIGESIAAKNKAGAVNVLYGSAQKLRKNGNQFFSQDAGGVAGTATANDGFASFLMPADFNGDGRDDLAIGVAYKTVASEANAGAMVVLMGQGASGLKGAGSQVWTQDSTGIADKCEKNDYAGFGAS